MSAEHLRTAAQTCARSFSFLVSEYGFGAPSIVSDKTSFTVRFQTQITGVQVSYSTGGGGLVVWICRLEAGSWPARPGRILADTEIRWFDLDDVRALVENQPPVVDDFVFAVPGDTELDAKAEDLRTLARPFLRGDFSLAPRLAERVRKRARENGG